MYDQVWLSGDEDHGDWPDDRATLTAAWADAGIQPTPVIRFSATADALSHFYFAAAATGGFVLHRRAFDALGIWLKGRADRRVHVRLADGTELTAATPEDVRRLAATVERLRAGAQAGAAPVVDVPAGTSK